MPRVTADTDRFREVVSHFATGVAVITASGPDGPRGLTTNAVASLSLDPLLMLVCLDNGARTLPAVRASGQLAINVLEAGQEDVSRLFASKVPVDEKFTGIAHTLEHGPPILDGVLAWLVCDVRELLPGGDHTIAIGAVTALHHAHGGPLLWYRGAYGALPAD
jgi:flavin reductase (DIM6/NTAB) family NADH-FMN oxidoreductase RutF